MASNIQSRISAFEALSSASTPNLLDSPNAPSPSPSPPILGRKTSLIDLNDDWLLHDDPAYAAPTITQSSAPPLIRCRPIPRPLPDSSHTTPLIHLQSSPPKSRHNPPPLPPRKPSYASLKSLSNSSTSSLARSPSGPAANMSLPPRRKSDSLNVDTYALPGTATPRGHAPASSISSFHSVSLSSDGGTDGGSLSSTHVATFPMDRDDTRQNRRDVDNVSLDSFENVSTVSPSVSSISMDWGDYVKRQPPKLPQRSKPPSHPLTPTPPSSSASNNLTSPRISPPPLAKQHPPLPPPPSRTRPPPPSNRSSLASTITSLSDQSSVLSAATSRTSLSSVRPPPTTPKPPSALLLQQKLTRPTPIPPAARTRYERVFVANVLAQRRFDRERERRALSPPPGRKVRQAAGWRGLSVDLITNPEVVRTSPPESVRGSLDLGAGSGESDGQEVVGVEERLDGRTVGVLWRKSRLEGTKLREIWTECDPTNFGSLDRVAFVKGMWRIDEELRRVQLTRRHRPSASLSPTIRQAHRKPSKPILR